MVSADSALQWLVAVILKDDTEGEEQNVYNKVDDVDFTQWTEDNYNYLKLIYEGAPSKVIAMRVATNVESYNAVLKKLKDLIQIRSKKPA